MPTMDEYRNSGGYARDSANSGGNVSTGGGGGSSSSGGFMTPGTATGGSTDTGKSGFLPVGTSRGGSSNPAPVPTYGGIQRYNPDAAATDRLSFFKGDKFEAQKEIAIVKDMYQKEKAGGANQQRLDEISNWADQVRGVSGIGVDDPYFGNNSNVAPDQQAAYNKQILDQMTGLDKSKFDAKFQGNSNDLSKKYESMLNDYMTKYQEQLDKMKLADAQKAELMKQEREKRKATMLGNFRSQYDASLAMQQGDLASAKSQSEADLRKAYDDAVKSGEMSVRQANDAFTAHKSQLDAQNYQASQSRNLLASQRGIGSSQQLLGMQTTDNSNFNQLASSAQTSRDSQLADIKSRLDAMGNTKNSETTRINEQYNANLNKAKGQADLAYNSAVNNVNVDDYNAENNFNNQMMAANRSMDLGSLNAQMGGMNNIMQQMMGSDLQSRQGAQQLQSAIQLANNGNMNQLAALAQQHGYDMQKMSAANGYDMQKLGSSQEFQKMMGEIQQGYTQDNMGTKYGYDTALQNNQFGHQSSLQGSANANQMEMLKQKGMIDRSNAMAKSDEEYRQAVERESAKYTPGTKEYDIMMKQQKAAKDQRTNDINQKFADEARIKETTTNPYLSSAQADMSNFGQIAPPNNFSLNPFSGNFWAGLLGAPYATPDGTSDQQKKIQAYDRYMKLMNNGGQ